MLLDLWPLFSAAEGADGTYAAGPQLIPLPLAKRDVEFTIAVYVTVTPIAQRAASAVSAVRLRRAASAARRIRLHPAQVVAATRVATRTHTRDHDWRTMSSSLVVSLNSTTKIQVSDLEEEDLLLLV